MKKINIKSNIEKHSSSNDNAGKKNKRRVLFIVLPIIIVLVIGVTYICGGFETIDYFLGG